MASAKIIEYKAYWDTGMNRGIISVLTDEGVPPQSLKFTESRSGEFCAVLQILQGDDDPYINKGIVGTGIEKPGDM